VDLLARLNDPVRSIAAGVVTRVEPLPQGGFAVVTAHANGLVSIVSGLRDVVVTAKTSVVPGQILGRAGRNLDGAVVVSVEIWRNRRPQDAARLLHIRMAS
jgi:murein DD-endopeptidase MepM/ murein hydrolase activator NlpD